ncbi:hypothetical protein UVI_02022700 [Ustilaginoidea virens]|uniref:GPI ethanolamine phosphate transferase 2 n=1 Tax=Ustilaginoidea virens TaxID=1159556 RepID=A0A1B5L3X6_USTVR|nr:hypothetical protein UVI_02022700 [Ustilaginoidea virens]
MPRLKAITTGSIPSFVDLILNFDEGDTSSTLAAQDTWLAQMRTGGSWSCTTWALTTSATNLGPEGKQNTHVSGQAQNFGRSLLNRDSGNMVPKQREMDGIVRMIYHAIETKDHLKSTLFVLCGDHGMNDAGNHGASSPGETSPALLFMSPKLKGMLPKLEAPAEPDNEFHYYRMVEQSDITPTMAAMLGFPVSKNNLGAFLTDFLPLWPVPRHQTQILVQNARQILRVIAAAFGGELFAPNNESNACTLEATLLNTLACQWQQLREKADVLLGSSDSDQDWIDSMSSWLRQAQELMSSMASNYDLSKLALGQIIATAAVICSVAGLLQINQHRRRNILPLSLISISYGAMMFASSYVEEEQHFWYWSSTFWIAHLGLKAMHPAKLTVMEISTTSLLLQYTSFFAFGGSNAISSVDLSNAYNGIGGFNIVAVGILTFISNWAGPIFWVFATNVLLLQKHRQGQPDVLPRHLSCLTLFSATSVAFVMAACTALRAHLFIWTVFSPKYLYCMAWSLAQHLAVNIVLGSLLFRLAAD